MYHLDENEINTEFHTEPFCSAVWKTVRTASSCKDLGAELQAAIENRDWESIEDIFENITHQMTFYSATYVVFPHLVKLLEHIMEEGDIEHAHMLIFNLGICLATDVPENHFEEVDSPLLDEYHAAAKMLAGLVKRYINTNSDEILEMDEVNRNMLLVAALAVFGERELVYVALDELASGEMEELPLMCGGDCDFFEECFEPLREDSEIGLIVPAQYKPGKWDGKSYDDAFLWTSALADMLGAKEQVEGLKYIYGTFTCPECGRTKRVLDFMVTYFTQEW